MQGVDLNGQQSEAIAINTLGRHVRLKTPSPHVWTITRLDINYMTAMSYFKVTCKIMLFSNYIDINIWTPNDKSDSMKLFS